MSVWITRLIVKAIALSPPAIPTRCSFRTHLFLSDAVPRAMPWAGMRCSFSAAAVAGSAGPGFHTWPSGHIPQDTASNPLFRIRSPAKQTFGEAFGAATVAGSAGPGFHNWPSGHIPQDNGPESAFSHPVPCQKDVRRGVRRRDRGQRPTATNDPNTKQLVPQRAPRHIGLAAMVTMTPLDVGVPLSWATECNGIKGLASG